MLVCLLTCVCFWLLAGVRWQCLLISLSVVDISQATGNAGQVQSHLQKGVASESLLSGYRRWRA